MLLAVRLKIQRNLGVNRCIFPCSTRDKESFYFVFQVLEVDSFNLCPSSAEGRKKEQLLQVICLVLAVVNVFVFSKLLYDYHKYKNTGILPRIIHWIPFL